MNTKDKLQSIVRDARDKLENTLLIEGILVVLEKLDFRVEKNKGGIVKNKTAIKDLEFVVEANSNDTNKNLQSLYDKDIRLDDKINNLSKIRLRHGKDGKDGYTPRKGIDYFDGEKGKDGYTPVKGIDYDDGRDGEDGKNGKDGITTIKEKELSGKAIIEKIEGSNRKLDASAIKNLPEGVKETVVREIHRIGSNGIRHFINLEDGPMKIEPFKYLRGSEDGKKLEFVDRSVVEDYWNIVGGVLVPSDSNDVGIDGTFNARGKVIKSIETSTGDATVGDVQVHVCNSETAYTLTLPEHEVGREIRIINKNLGAVTLSPDSGTVKGAVAETLYTGEVLILISDGEDWI